MSAQPAKLQAAEHDLKQLMADVTRAMEKAQEAVARMAAKAAAPTETEAASLVRVFRGRADWLNRLITPEPPRSTPRSRRKARSDRRRAR